jgi:GTP-binding protein LepA
LLHLEVVQERLEREYDLSLILTAPSVRYRLIMNDGTGTDHRQPGPLSRPHRISSMPWSRSSRPAIIIPDRYMGAVMKLCLERRGINKNYQYLTNNRLEMIFELPLGR